MRSRFNYRQGIHDSKALTYRSATLAGFHSEHLTHDLKVLLTSLALLHFVALGLSRTTTITLYKDLYSNSVVYVMDNFTSFFATSRTVES